MHLFSSEIAAVQAHPLPISPVAQLLHPNADVPNQKDPASQAEQPQLVFSLSYAQVLQDATALGSPFVPSSFLFPSHVRRTAPQSLHLSVFNPSPALQV